MHILQGSVVHYAYSQREVQPSSTGPYLYIPHPHLTCAHTHPSTHLCPPPPAMLHYFSHAYLYKMHFLPAYLALVFPIQIIQ